MGRRIRLVGMIALVSCAMLSLCFLFFACIHWHNYWSFFTVLPCLFAFFAPSICYGYQDAGMVQTAMDDETFQNCRELGYAVAVLFLLSAYGVPVLAWYNANFPLGGVLVMYGSITLSTWSFLFWRRMFL